MQKQRKTNALEATEAEVKQETPLNTSQGSGDAPADLEEAQPTPVLPHPTGEATSVDMDGPDSFEIVHLIGKGDVGRVYLVRHKATGLPYAMKAMSKHEMVKRKKVGALLSPTLVHTISYDSWNR